MNGCANNFTWNCFCAGNTTANSQRVQTAPREEATVIILFFSCSIMSFGLSNVAQKR